MFQLASQLELTSEEFHIAVAKTLEGVPIWDLFGSIKTACLHYKLELGSPPKHTSTKPRDQLDFQSRKSGYKLFSPSFHQFSPGSPFVSHLSFLVALGFDIEVYFCILIGMIKFQLGNSV